MADYFSDGSDKSPRYYQRNAINAAIEAIATGHNRGLLVMATGTGKTYTAFQIIWRLWKSGRKKRILFLADRNILIEQTMVNDFRPFAGKMGKLSTSTKTIERDDGTKVDFLPPLTNTAASIAPTKSTSVSIKPSPAPKTAKNSASNSQKRSSTSSSSTNAIAAALPPIPPGAKSSTTSNPPPKSA